MLDYLRYDVDWGNVFCIHIVLVIAAMFVCCGVKKESPAFKIAIISILVVLISLALIGIVSFVASAGLDGVGEYLVTWSRYALGFFILIVVSAFWPNQGYWETVKSRRYIRAARYGEVVKEQTKGVFNWRTFFTLLGIFVFLAVLLTCCAGWASLL